MAKKKKTKKDIIIKAIKDKEFYKALKKNPKKVLEKEFGYKLPKDLKVKVVDQKENELFIVIPKIFKGEKISEKQLKKIAGGIEKYKIEPATSDCLGCGWSKEELGILAEIR